MANSIKTLKNIRIFSVVAMLTIVAMGFIITFSLFQAFVLSPVLLLLTMGLYGYADFKLDMKVSNAEVHHLSHVKAKACIFSSRKRAA